MPRAIFISEAEWSKISDRFYSKVEVGIGCHLWTAGTFSTARVVYGQFWLHYSNFPAHRVAWALEEGSVSEDDLVLHRCDTGLCTRKSHLFLGDNHINTQDMLSKGRCRSVKYPIATVQQIHKLRTQGLSQASISSRTGVSESQVSRILLGQGRKGA